MSLAAEARIIRHQARKFPGEHPTRLGLYLHRIHDVRSEQRSALLAYGFLRGRAYRRLEQRAYTRPNWKRVEEIAKKFGTGDHRELLQRFAAWKDEGTESGTPPAPMLKTLANQA